jgi:hypothetical protein
MEAKVDPRRCTVDLTHFGEDNGSGNSSFSFTTRDKNGDIVSTNTLFGAKIMNQQDGKESEVVIKKMKDEGQYEVLFQPLNHGVYLVVLGILSATGSIIQEMVKGSPFTVRVGPDPEQDKRIFPDPTRCYIFGPGSRRGVVKRKCTFVLQACGADGTKVKNGGDPFKVKVVPPSGGKLASLPSSIQDQKDGTYTVSFTPAIAGEHIVHLTAADDVHIADSPFCIPISDSIEPGEEVDPSNTVIDLDHPVKLARNVFGFPISAKNVNGKSMQVSLHFRARVISPDSLDLQNKVVECENGTFLLKFVPKQSGRHDIDVDVCVNGTDQFTPVIGSPVGLDLALTFGDEAKVESMKVLSKKPREKTYDNPSERVSPGWEPSKSPDIPPPRLNLNRESSARSPPPQWVPTSSPTPSKIPPHMAHVTRERRSFSSPPPISVSLLKSITSPPPSPSSPLAPPSHPLSHIPPANLSGSLSSHSSSSSSPKPTIPPKNPASPLSTTSPPAWFVSKKAGSK